MPECSCLMVEQTHTHRYARCNETIFSNERWMNSVWHATLIIGKLICVWYEIGPVLVPSTMSTEATWPHFRVLYMLLCKMPTTKPNDYTLVKWAVSSTPRVAGSQIENGLRTLEHSRLSYAGRLPYMEINWNSIQHVTCKEHAQYRGIVQRCIHYFFFHFCLPRRTAR